jgi:hypothetical protein
MSFKESGEKRLIKVRIKPILLNAIWIRISLYKALEIIKLCIYITKIKVLNFGGIPAEACYCV